MPKLEDLELKIKQTGSISTKGFKNLSEALERLSAAVKSFPKQADNVAAVNSAIKSINADKATALAKVATGLAKLADSASKVDVKSAGNIAAIGAAIEQMVDGIDTTKLSTISDALSKFKTSVNALKNGGGINRAVKESAVKSLGETTAPAEKETVAVTAEDVSEDVSEASEKVEKFRTNLWQLFKTAKAPMWSPIKKGIQSIQEHLKKAASGAINLLSAFKRIAMYRMLRTAIKSITQGFATGIKHLYAWSDLVGNNFKQSMDSLSTSANYLRNSLGAMVSPLIDALAPAVEVLVEKFVTLLNTINQFFATITGADTWRRAVRQQKEYAENTDKAAGAQKKLNHQLMAFDELNNITMGGSGGSGSGGKTPEVDDGSFVIEQTPDWAKGIKEAIENGDWYGAGAALATKINGLLDDFNAAQFGQNLADKIQNGINAFNGFMNTLDWTGVGLKASEVTNELFKNVTPESVGEAIIQPINAGIQMLKGLVVGGYKEYLDPTTGETFREWKDGLDFSGIGEWIGTAFMTAINNIKWEEAGETLGKLASGLASLIVSAIHQIDVSDVLTALRDFFGGLFSGLWGEDGKGMLDIIELTGWILGIKLVFKGLQAAFSSTFSDAVVGGAAEAFSETGAAAVSVKGFMDTFAGKLGTVALVVGLTYYIATSGEINTPEKAAEKVEAENPFFNVFEDTDTDSFKDGFLEALKHDPVVQKAYNDNLYQWGKDSAHQDQNAALAAARAKYEELIASSGTGTMTDKVSALYEETSTGTSQRLQKMREDIDYINNHPATVKVNDKDQMLQKSSVRAGKLVGSTGLGGVKKQYNTELRSPSLYEAEGATTTINSGLKKLNGTKYTTTFKSDSLKTGAKQADTLKGGMNAVGGKTIRMAFKSDSLKVGAKNASTVKDSTKAFSGKTATFTFKSPSLKTGASNAATLDKSMNDLDGNTYSVKMTEDGLSTSAENSKLVYESLNGLAKNYAVALSVTGLSTAAEKAQALRDALKDSGKNWKINITSDLRLKSANGTSFTVEPLAEGGFPAQGSLFLAGETVNQTELVGNINGRTGVASGAEITGIADAVYNTGESEAALLREQNRLLRQILAKNTNVTLAPTAAAGRWVNQAQTAYARATGV